MKTLLIFSFLLISKSFCSDLIPAAIKVKSAFEKLSADKTNKKLQLNYIAAFPSDSKTFLNVFETEKFDQLYSESDKYIDALENCAKYFPKEVIGKCVDIGKNLKWNADAVGYLQHLNISLAINHLSEFIEKFKTLDKQEQDKLIKFYADVENHNAYPEYQNLIDKLNSMGQKDISAKLETEREIRKKVNNH